MAINPFDPAAIKAQLSPRQEAILKATGEKSMRNNMEPIHALANKKADGSYDIDAIYDEAIEISIHLHTFHSKRMLNIDITQCSDSDAKILKEFREKEGKRLKALTETQLNQSAVNDIFLSYFQVAREPGDEIDLDMVRACLRKGVNIHYSAPANPRLTALHWSIIGNDKRGFDFLLEQGADFSLADKSGYFPLKLAAQEGRKEMVIALLAKGADPSQKFAGRTAEFFAKNADIRAIIVAAQKAKAEQEKAGKEKSEKGDKDTAAKSATQSAAKSKPEQMALAITPLRDIQTKTGTAATDVDKTATDVEQHGSKGIDSDIEKDREPSKAAQKFM